MSAQALLALIQALLQAAPNLVALYDQLKSGATVTPAQVATALGQYPQLQAQALADLAADTQA